ncbi:M13 family metallopeptidase [Sphingomonas lenta]|uniref:Endothelin-converting protein n=1 Tax=Sphingomonas lenta TaxID=1141887 RepID=A0A2A2SGF7_9SPHN|nr:M13 family metallopeptidase [Sphingomonas lenta]PAX08295.1 endothelin-converting protein [Sphingomonas lenta]
MRFNGMKYAFGAAALALAAAGVAQTAGAPAGGKAAYGEWGVDLSARDTGVKPGDDFWTYVNGGWDRRTPIAPDRSSAGLGVKLSDQAELDVRRILDDMAADPARYGATGRQVGDFYASWMDEAGVEARGTAPLKPYLSRIAAVKDQAGLQTLFASVGYQTPVSIGILPDLADPTRYTAIAGQSGLGMPRDYYLLPGEKYDAFRKAYRAYVQRVQELAGIPDAAAKADRIVALETEMAKGHWEPAKMRDVAALNKPMTPAQMEALAPEFDWGLMLRTAKLDRMPTVIMAGDTAIQAMGKLFAATPVDTWKDYLAFHFVSDNAQYLPKAFDDAKFDFYSRTLSGTQQQRDRWKRGVQLVNNSLGEAVGDIYVQRHFPAQSKAEMGELIADLRAALDERLKANSWMDAATKEKALAKLAAFEPRIGHPDKYIDYSSMRVDRADLLGNAQRAAQFEYDLQLSRLGKPVDRSLWAMTPQTVNAYYNPLMNQITFPAAILQPPMFDASADPAVNYGAIGAVIGHEIGHGFDDQGSKFGASGKFENWWTPAARAAFEERGKKLVEQYGAYEAIPGTKINGQLTLGENIGDLGGLEMAYAAYQRYQKKHGPAPVIGGLTGDQRFFMAWGQAWQSKRREGLERQALLTDPHSPPKYRVNGVVRNIDAWYKAFDVKPGDALYLPPEQRVRIW